MGMNHSKCAYLATLDGRTSDLYWHITKGAELSRIDPTTGRSLMHVASERGHVRCVELINQNTKGRHLNHPDKNENTPLNVAVYWNHFEAVRYLLSQGADPNYGEKNRKMRFRRMPHHIAATKTNPRILQELLIRGSHIDAQDSWGCTPLMVAINSRCLESLKLLLKFGASLEIRDYYYEATALQLAIRERFNEAVPFLLDYGADVEATGGKLPVPLEQVAKMRNLYLMKILLEYGANISCLSAYLDNAYIADLVEEFSQPLRLSRLCRIVLRRFFKWELPQIAKNLFAPNVAEFILDLNISKLEPVIDEMDQDL